MAVDTWRGFRLEELKRCPLCGRGRSELAYCFDLFGVNQCSTCGVGYLSPRVVEDDIIKIYQDPSYFSSDSRFGYSDYESQQSGLRRSFGLLVEKLIEFGRAKGSLLEIGCGPGLFLQEAKEYFDHIVGLDLSEDALRAAVNYADEVVVGGVDALSENDQFDLVVAISLIEHVYGPHRFMKRMMAHLKESGAILFVTPEWGGVWHTLLGRKWPSFKIPEHVLFYSRKALRYLGDCYGLESSFFAFTQFAPVALVLNSLGVMKGFEAAWLTIDIPVPHTMIAVLYKRP